MEAVAVIEGMSCGSCAAHIESQCQSKLPEVLRVTVNFATKQGRFVLRDDGTHDTEEWKVLIGTTIRDLGFSVKNVSIVDKRPVRPPARLLLIVDGMSCGSCAAHLEDQFKSVFGPRLQVVNVNVSTKHARLTITRVEGVADGSLLSAAEQCVTSSGYTVVGSKAESADLPQTENVVVTGLVEGMSCGSCAAYLERELPAKCDSTEMNLVKVSVNFATKQLRAEFSGSACPSDARLAVESAVVGLGFSMHAVSAQLLQQERSKLVEVPWTSITLSVPGADLDNKLESQLLTFLHRDGVRVIDRVEVDAVESRIVLWLAPQTPSTSAVLLRSVYDSVQYLADRGTPNVEITSVTTGSSGRTAADAADTVNETRSALERRKEIGDHRRRFFSSLLFTIPVDVVMLLCMFVPSLHLKGNRRMWLHTAEMIVTAPVVGWCGREFFVKAWVGLKHKSFTMDTLVSVGVGSSFVFSVASLLVMFVTGTALAVYFDAAANLTTFMLLGRFLEATAKRHTSSALISLMRVMPSVARLIVADGKVDVQQNGVSVSDEAAHALDVAPTFTIPSSALSIGHLFRVLPGDSIAADGVVVRGTSDVDEQLITGESVPRTVSLGDSVTGGTVNQNNVIVVAATRVGEDTTLSNILRIVQDAQSTKPAIQRLADKIAGVFVPVVVGYALVVLLTWLLLGHFDAYPASWRTDNQSYYVFAFSFFVSTIVVACPCALGLATPTAVMVGTGVGAASGVLIKSGAMLEISSRVNCVLFDKTGTLTIGRLDVVSCDAFDTLQPDVVRAIVTEVEGQSAHPIAVGVTRYLRDAADSQSACRVRVVSSTSHPGFGVSALVEVTYADGSVRQSLAAVGSLTMMMPENYPLWATGASDGVRDQPPPHQPGELLLACVRRSTAAGRTTIVASIDGVPSLVVGLSDCPKPEARGVVAHLKRNGVRVAMVTGDHKSVAAHIARRVGIDQGNTFAEVLPAGKADIVKKLQADGLTVAFVGDGINDSPALVQADVGVALGAGTDIAVDAADAVLMHSSLADLCTFFALSQQTVRRIKMNFVWAFGYNCVMLPVASGVFFPWWRYQLSPIVAGMAMVCSSLSVLCSSLLLRCFTPQSQASFVGEGESSLQRDGSLHERAQLLGGVQGDEQ